MPEERYPAPHLPRAASAVRAARGAYRTAKPGQDVHRPAADRRGDLAHGVLVHLGARRWL